MRYCPGSSPVVSSQYHSAAGDTIRGQGQGLGSSFSGQSGLGLVRVSPVQSGLVSGLVVVAVVVVVVVAVAGVVVLVVVVVVGGSGSGSGGSGSGSSVSGSGSRVTSIH